MPAKNTYLDIISSFEAFHFMLEISDADFLQMHKKINHITLLEGRFHFFELSMLVCVAKQTSV